MALVRGAFAWVGVAFGLVGTACTVQDGNDSVDGGGGTGGALGSGGTGASESPTSGGASLGGGPATGGVPAASGGRLATGGAAPTGGASSGGASPEGGAAPTGGASPTGGTSPTGGASPNGGSPPNGGASANGGASGGPPVGPAEIAVTVSLFDGRTDEVGCDPCPAAYGEILTYDPDAGGAVIPMYQVFSATRDGPYFTSPITFGVSGLHEGEGFCLIADLYDADWFDADDHYGSRTACLEWHPSGLTEVPGYPTLGLIVDDARTDYSEGVETTLGALALEFESTMLVFEFQSTW